TSNSRAQLFVPRFSPSCCLPLLERRRRRPGRLHLASQLLLLRGLIPRRQFPWPLTASAGSGHSWKTPCTAALGCSNWAASACASLCTLCFGLAGNVGEW